MEPLIKRTFGNTVCAFTLFTDNTFQSQCCLSILSESTHCFHWQGGHWRTSYSTTSPPPKNLFQLPQLTHSPVHQLLSSALLIFESASSQILLAILKLPASGSLLANREAEWEPRLNGKYKRCNPRWKQNYTLGGRLCARVCACLVCLLLFLFPH